MTENNTTLALVPKDRDLPEPVARRGITEAAWLTLVNNLYPGANPKSVLMVWDYCAARHLDPLKKPVHIVPMEVKVGDRYEWRDVVMPGVYEHRTTAHRTGQYLGHTEPTYGPDKEFAGVTAPEWCAMTMLRLVAGQRAEFPVKVFFREVVATKRDGSANARWKRAPIQMLTKCTEAAGVREAFPEETGGEPTAEEMDGQRVLDVLPDHADIPQSPGLVAFGKLSEAMQDVVERAMAAANLTPGMRVAKLNEYLATASDLDIAAKALIDWCATKPGVQRADNSKRPNAPSSDSSPTISASKPNVETSDSRGSSPELTAPGSGNESPAPLTAKDIPFAGSTTAGGGASEKVGF